MEPRLILAIAGVAYFVAVLWAARRSARGDSRFTGLVYVPVLLGGLVGIWAGISVASSNLAFGLVLVLTGAITVVLLVRAWRAAPASPISHAHAGGMPESWVDYLIWTAIGAPIVLAVLLLAFAIAERYNSP